jgi:hypothetical protein
MKFIDIIIHPSNQTTQHCFTPQHHTQQYNHHRLIESPHSTTYRASAHRHSFILPRLDIGSKRQR